MIADDRLSRQTSGRVRRARFPLINSASLGHWLMNNSAACPWAADVLAGVEWRSPLRNRLFSCEIKRLFAHLKNFSPGFIALAHALQ
jgi:hypothetical protein